MPNLGEHGREETRDTLFPCGVYEYLILAFDVLWIGGVVDNPARDSICEFRDASLDKVVDVGRDSPNRDRFVAVWGLGDASMRLQRFKKGSSCSYVFVSGLKNVNPRSESRRLS
jgi:hypothetical protein